MKPELVKIENEPGYAKDKASKAIVSTDNSALEAYRARRKREQDRLDEINNLKQDVAEIKDLLRQILGSKGQS
jgi:uncharacterized protein YicC (UPF0701 family)